ncbi:MAG: nucleotidyl transferase AbiEii/AbiGii toxin family protein [Candidatus Omnitrophota bacterium]
MKRDIKNIKASVRARLQNKAKEDNRPFSEVLQYYGMERLLYRVSQSKYADNFILKGALMFMVWHVPERRTTLDIDFLAQYDNKIAGIERMIKDICKIKVVSDGLIFDSKNVKGQRIKEDADYEGVRVKFVGLLERSRIPMQIDIAFGDSIYPKPRIIEYPVILDFPKPKLKGYPAESIVSEKFEAMIKLGLLNSRMKDFYDIWLMMHQFDFNGLRLVEALKRTFKQRKTVLPQRKPLFAEEIYDGTSDRQTLWRAFLKKADVKHAPKKLSTTVKAIEKFLFEPLVAVNKSEKFNAKWKAPGPWE